MDGEARLARYRVRDVAVERPFTLLVAPRERVQMRLRLNIAPHIRLTTYDLQLVETRPEAVFVTPF